MSVVKTLIGSTIGTLVIAMSGFGVNLAFGKDITLMVDGQGQDLSVIQGSVAELLADQGITLTAHDRVYPDLDTKISDAMTVEVDYGRPIDLTLNGQQGTYWTYATTVDGVLSGLGLGESSIKVSVPQTAAVSRDGLNLTIDTGYDVTVTADGQTLSLHAFGTVDNALAEAGLTWDADDLLTPPAGTALSDQLAISLVRVDQQTVTRDSPIPFDTQNSSDPDSPQGKVTVVTKGIDGLLTETILQTLHDGAVADEVVTGQAVTAEPVTQVTTTGTKVPETPPVVPAGDAQQIAHDMLRQRGWGEDQFSCLVSLWNRESGWRTTAGNRHSGAYGIPQALPGSKMASAGPDWQTNPATQITWGLGYISGRYGTPCGAWSSFQSKGWY